MGYKIVFLCTTPKNIYSTIPIPQCFPSKEKYLVANATLSWYLGGY